MSTPAAEKLIVALDAPSAADALRLVDKLDDLAVHYKVGLELFNAAGPHVVLELARRGKKVFLDLKLHDIPNTVKRAGAAIARLGVRMFNVHALGGNAMMKAAIDGARSVEAKGEPVRVIAVTILTSHDDAAVRTLGLGNSALDAVVRLAREAEQAGLDGVVASAREADAVRAACGDDFNAASLPRPTPSAEEPTSSWWGGPSPLRPTPQSLRAESSTKSTPPQLPEQVLPRDRRTLTRLRAFCYNSGGGAEG